MVKIKHALLLILFFILTIGFTNAALAQDVKLTAQEAMTIALEKVDPKVVGEITSIEIETEEDIIVYAVEFTKDGIETDVKINAKTGEVIKIENDLTEMAEEEENQ